MGIGPTAASPDMPFQADFRASPSPSTSDFQSPTFTYASLDSVEVMSEGDYATERDPGDTYDKAAAAEQRRKMVERSAGSGTH